MGAKACPVDRASFGEGQENGGHAGNFAVGANQVERIEPGFNHDGFFPSKSIL
jgi:hypothetical protein